jgi:hypothetical protein
MINKILLTTALLLLLSTFLYNIVSNTPIPPGFSQEWVRTNFSKTTIDIAEISPEEIASNKMMINNPVFIATNSANFLDKHAPVISLNINGDYRAYPLGILIYHNIINDIVGNVPIAVTYSPTSNSAIIYKRTIGTKLLEFNMTGKYRHANRLFYDKETYSWWQQFNGEAVIGNMSGTILETVPARIESFENFRNRAPNSKTLIPLKETNYSYTPYAKYDSLRWPPLFSAPYYEAIPAMTYVVVAENQAWLLQNLREQREVTHNELRLRWSEGQSSILDAERISEAKDLGNVTVQTKDKKGIYRDIPYIVTFAFAFNAFYPEGITHY